MRISVTYASWLLPLLASLALMQGCDQKTKPAQTQTLAPPIVDTQPTKPETVPTADLPPPVVGTPQPTQAAADNSVTKPAETPKKPAHHPKKPAPAATTPTQDASNGTSSGSGNPASSVSAIGQLSGGASGDLRSQTEETISATEKGVDSITRALSDSETKTAAQIHEFLKQARQALTTGDVDGAQTLVKKAKVLLAELNQ
jgi:hypothetical protein